MYLESILDGRSLVRWRNTPGTHCRGNWSCQGDRSPFSVTRQDCKPVLVSPILSTTPATPSSVNVDDNWNTPGTYCHGNKSCQGYQTYDMSLQCPPCQQPNFLQIPINVIDSQCLENILLVTDTHTNPIDHSCVHRKRKKLQNIEKDYVNDKKQ